MEDKSNIIDFYLGKIDGKNMILIFRDTYEITEDNPSVLDTHGINSNKILKDNNIIGDKEESIIVTLVKESYYSLSTVFVAKMIVENLAHILYISSKENCNKTIYKKDILNILEDYYISCPCIITYKDDKYYIGRRCRKLYITDFGEEVAKNSESIIFSHYVYT